MKCTVCGKEISDSAKFCNGCGAPVAVAPIIDIPISSPAESSKETTVSKTKKEHLTVPLLLIVSVLAITIGLLIYLSGRKTSSSITPTGLQVSEQPSERTDSAPVVEDSNRMVSLPCGAELSPNAIIADLRGYRVANRDMAALKKCNQLQEIYIDGGDVDDISSLSELEHLQVLHLNNVPVMFLSALHNLPDLRELNIMDTHVTLWDVDALLTQMDHAVEVVGYETSCFAMSDVACSWSEAQARCEQEGGHLATISSEWEFDQLVSLAKDMGLTYIWLGGYSENKSWSWVTGEPWNQYGTWYPGEPSYTDHDGTPEGYLCLWDINGQWSLNDQRNDLLSLVPPEMVGYAMEKDGVSGFKPVS